MLELERLCVSYGAAGALHDVSMSIAAGELAVRRRDRTARASRR
jgi:ABC-type branched-subunit amino acid transport system ATPase component